jgi:intracellular sulfur oxidation DsrE/DsrF family protein
MKFLQSVLHRRSFVTAALTAASFTKPGILQAQSPLAARWQPAREEQDDWLERIPGKHRMVLDTTTPEGFGYALLYAGNYYIANADAYGLKDNDLAVVIVARHHATPFALNDAMWKKYGKPLSRLAHFKDPRTKTAPTSNLYNLPLDIKLPNRGGTIDALVKRGVQFAVCQMATQQLADSFAEVAGGTGEGVFKELSANLVGNSRLVPAGIVAANRAQERGYSLVNV